MNTVDADVIIEHVGIPPDNLITEAVDIYVDLEKDSAALNALTAGEVGKLPNLAKALMTPLVKGVGDLYTARNLNGDLVGFAFWTAPGKGLFDSDDQMEMGYTDFLKSLPQQCVEYHAEVMGKKIPALIDKSIGFENAATKTYWCEFIYVRADYQRRGIASAFINMVHEKAKQLGCEMALTTQESKNVTIYEQLKFKMVGSEMMPSPWGDWQEWVFVRRAEG